MVCDDDFSFDDNPVTCLAWLVVLIDHIAYSCNITIIDRLRYIHYGLNGGLYADFTSFMLLYHTRKIGDKSMMVLLLQRRKTQSGTLL
ncbi:hypothetical protein CRN79_18270 [Serratia fonticola]|nr:hypothetical protein CRN79_18270 [Serratia fonticola]